MTFSSLTDRRVWAWVMTSPGRTGSPKRIAAWVTTASGRSSMAFSSKCSRSGTGSSVAPGAQLCGRDHSESVVGGRIGPRVSSAATASSQNSGFAL